MMLRSVSMWLGGRDAGAYLGYSRDWVEIRAIKWQPDHVPGRIRYKKNKENGDRKYYVPDLDSFLE
jgi:hypothetical protein